MTGRTKPWGKAAAAVVLVAELAAAAVQQLQSMCGMYVCSYYSGVVVYHKYY